MKPYKQSWGTDWGLVSDRKDHPRLNYSFSSRNDNRKFYSVSSIVAEELGLATNEANVLFNEDWQPREDMTVPEALRAIAGGADIESVTHDDYYYED